MLVFTCVTFDVFLINSHSFSLQQLEYTSFETGGHTEPSAIFKPTNLHKYKPCYDFFQPPTDLATVDRLHINWTKKHIPPNEKQKPNLSHFVAHINWLWTLKHETNMYIENQFITKKVTGCLFEFMILKNTGATVAVKDRWSSGSLKGFQLPAAKVASHYLQLKAKLSNT